MKVQRTIEFAKGKSIPSVKSPHTGPRNVP